MPDHDRRSLWQATAEALAYPPPDGDHSTDVVVVGGGITGLTTALLLAEAGVEVTVLEARHVAAGTTGGTTGKVTSQHGMIYHDLAQSHGAPVARAYADINEEAIREIADICDRHGIAANWTPTDAYAYAQSEAEVASLRRELAAAQSAGLPADWVDRIPLPLEVQGAVRVSGQAQLHPVAYANGLARTLERHPGASVHCRARVTDVTVSGGRVRVTTEDGVRVHAGHAVLATLLPITDRGFEFARTQPYRSYGVAAVLDGGEGPGDAASSAARAASAGSAGSASAAAGGMYLAAGEPSRSVRYHHGEDASYVIVVGDGHEVGHGEDTRRHGEALETFARRHFPVREVAFRWSAQDYLPDDRLPFIGATGLSDRILVATGFQKWGLTNGTAAARILTGTITGEEHPHAGVFSPTRATVSASARRFLEHNLDVAARFVGDRMRPDVDHVDDLGPGEGGTVIVDGHLKAVSKDHEGRTTIRSATCTHLGCIVQWNRAERSWDCPCHGSRFTATGSVLEGPATRPMHDG